MNREVVCELIQNKLNQKNLTKELKKILVPFRESELKSDYEKLEKQLGGKGASKKVASLVFKSLI